ncbi:uncharacterized protein BKA78DRAFT_379606 [Phyllosticta capitalensis]|uniref:uncharacterized protein n=1 Tax=Phyllosticta capitalensis TaxID=121624 RepID=UPI00312E3BAB
MHTAALPFSVSEKLSAFIGGHFHFTLDFTLPFTISDSAKVYIGLFTLLFILIVSCLILSFFIFILPAFLCWYLYDYVIVPLTYHSRRTYYRFFPRGIIDLFIPQAYTNWTLDMTMRLQEHRARFNRRGTKARLQQETPLQSPIGESILDSFYRPEEDYAEKRLRILQRRDMGELVFS